MFTRLGIAFVAVAALVYCLAATAQGATNKPDLIVRSAYIISDEVATGKTLKMTAIVGNRGSAVSRSTRLGFLLSKDSKVDITDVALDSTVRLPALRPRQTRRIRARVRVQPSVRAGSYRVIACADPRRSVREGREANNCRTAPARVEIIDRTPPAPPVIEALFPGPPMPSANHQMATIRSEVGARVRLYLGDCKGTLLGEGAVYTGGQVHIGVTQALSGAAVLSAQAVDASDNESQCSRPRSFTVLPPASTPINLQFSPASPSTEANPRLLGTTSGETVQVFRGPRCPGPAIVSGTVSEFADPGIVVPVAPGSRDSYSARTLDHLRRASRCSASVQYIHDGPPAAPTLTTGTPSPSNLAELHVRGRTKAGATVSVYAAPDCTGAAVSTAVASSGVGSFRATLAVPQDAITQFSARAVDTLQRPSPCGQPLTFTESGAWEAEPNDTQSSADERATDDDLLILGAVDWLARFWPSTSDRDVFRVEANGTHAVSLAVLAREGDSCPADVDFNLSLQSYGGGVVGSDTNTGLDRCAELIETVAGGTYYAQVENSSLTAPGGEYRLVADLLPAAVPEYSSPSSPAEDGTPEIVGSGTPASTVAIYATDDCTGSPLATGPAGDFGTFSLTVAVPANTQVTLHADATKDGVTGPCSAEGVAYTNSTPAP